MTKRKVLKLGSLIFDRNKLAIRILAIAAAIILCFPVTGCAKEEPKDKTKGRDMSILQKKPVFELKVDVFGTTHYIDVNGVTVLRDVGEDSQTSVVLPINHWMRSGENRISVDVFPAKRDKELNPNSYIRLALTVHDRNEPDKVFTVATLNFSGTRDVNKSQVGASSPSGIYASAKEFKEDKNGDVEVYDVIVRPRETFTGALIIERKINIPNALPLWAFFNSEEMPDYQALYSADDEKYDKAMMPLFAEYEKIQNALARKDVDSILPMFDERNRETDMAFYLDPGTTATRMKEALTECIQDLKENKRELVNLRMRGVDYHLEDNKKLVSLRRNRMAHAIVFNFINEKDALGAERYPMYFRYQNGKYILTR